MADIMSQAAAVQLKVELDRREAALEDRKAAIVNATHELDVCTGLG